MSESSSVSEEQLKSLLEQCAAIEEKAGLAAAVEKAEAGRFFPLGIDGEDCSSDEYFADEHDHFREKIRDAYFSVSDPELRMALISARRRVDSELAQSFDREASAARQAEAAAAQKSENQPWWLAASLAVACVALGYAIFQLPGAIAGGVAGYFLGLGAIQSAKNNANMLRRNAQVELQAALDNLARSKLHPECFTRGEQLTGDRDEAFDKQCALDNVRAAGDTANNSFKPSPLRGLGAGVYD